MRQIQVDISEEYSEEAKKVLDQYSSDVSSSEIEKNDENFVEFSVTVDQEEIDEISEKLKGLEVESGDLSIRVIDQESLIEKGVKTRGPSAGILSSQEVYSKAQEASKFNKAQWGMVALSGALAGIGLSTSNLIVLLGAILLAPVLYPLAAFSISIKMGDRQLAFQSLRTSFFSVLSIFVASIPVYLVLGSSSMDVLLEGIELVILSVIVGSAAILTFISEYREEMAGAALAVAIVPPAALTGNFIVLMDWSGMIHAAQVLLINILTVIISGYGILALFGAKPLTHYRLKDAQKLKFVFIGLTGILVAILITTL